MRSHSPFPSFWAHWDYQDTGQQSLLHQFWTTESIAFRIRQISLLREVADNKVQQSRSWTAESILGINTRYYPAGSFFNAGHFSPSILKSKSESCLCYIKACFHHYLYLQYMAFTWSDILAYFVSYLWDSIQFSTVFIYTVRFRTEDAYCPAWPVILGVHHSVRLCCRQNCILCLDLLFRR